MTPAGQQRIAGRSIARNAVLNFAGLVVPLVVAFATLPFIISGLGTARFGILSIVWLLLTYLSELGFGTTTTRYAADALGAGRHADLAPLVWTIAAFQAAVGLVLGLLLAAATPWLTGSVLQIPQVNLAEARTCFYLLAAALPWVGWGRAFRGLLEAAQRFDLAVLVHLPLTALTYILAAAGAQAGWSLAAVMTVVVVSRIVTIPAYYLAARTALPQISLRPAIRVFYLRQTAAFASWVAVSTVVSPLLMYLDRFMIGALLSMTAVAFYAAPYEVVARLTYIPGAVVGALFPALSQLNTAEAATRREELAARCATLLVLVLAPALVLIVGGSHDLLFYWLGAELAARSAAAMQVLAVGVLVNAVAHVPYALLQSSGRPDLPARFHIIELPLQIVLAWLLIRSYGITGAAWAWTARMTIDALLLFAAAQRLGLLQLRVLRQHAVPTALMTAAIGILTALAAGAFLDHTLLRLLIVGSIAALIAIMLWWLAVSESERRRIVTLFRMAG